MAFERKNFVRIGSSQTNEVPTIWQYKSTTDQLDDIVDPNYFVEVSDILQVGDGIFVTGSDPSSDLLGVEFIAVGQVVVVTSIVSGLAGSPVRIIKFASTFIPVGGSATFTIPITGVLQNDIAITQMKEQGIPGIRIESAATVVDGIDIELNVDPAGTPTIISYEVLRSVTQT